MVAFVMLGLVSSVPREQIDWEERLRNDLFCVEFDVNINSNSYGLRHGAIIRLEAA